MAGRSNEPGRTVAGKISMILAAISEGNRSLTGIATRCELPLSTVHRLATDLAAWRLLERADDGTYRAGPRLRAFSGPGDADADEPLAVVRELAVTIMEDLVRATGACVRVGVLDDAGAVAYVGKDSLHTPVSCECPAARLPAHASASGKALLAFSPPRLVDRLLAGGLRAYTPFTVTDPRHFRAALRIIRTARIAMCDRELRPEARAVAAPVVGVGGRAVAAIELEAHDLVKDLAAWRSALVVATGMLARELARHRRFGQAPWQYTGGARVDLGATGS